MSGNPHHARAAMGRRLARALEEAITEEAGSREAAGPALLAAYARLATTVAGRRAAEAGETEERRSVPADKLIEFVRAREGDEDAVSQTLAGAAEYLDVRTRSLRGAPLLPDGGQWDKPSPQ